MNIQQLKYVIAISDTGSYNKASEILYISQASLTNSIQDLEKEIGITIFNRSSRGTSLTSDGIEFVRYARQIVYQYDVLCEKYGEGGNLKKKFGVSTLHYSFAVKSFVDMVKQFGTDEYDFAIRETKTLEVIDDVVAGRSELGILYLSNFNRRAIEKLLRSNELEFHFLTSCDAYVYLWKGHPLAKKKSIRFADLDPYPCLSFEQGAQESFYFAEEILSTAEYPRTIKANDRATMLNLMIGLNGYTLCSGIISDELNGGDFVAVPFDSEGNDEDSKMEIGYIVKKNTLRSNMAELYIEEISKFLKEYPKV